MSLVLASSGGGSITLQEPVTASNLTQELAAVAGTLAPLVSGTAQASTSGTVRDFTGIPSWAKRVTVMFSDVSTSGTSVVQIQLGTAGGVEITGYLGITNQFSSTGAGINSLTTGVSIGTNADAATGSRHGAVTFNNLSGNLWVASGIVGDTGATRSAVVSYRKTLSAILDRVRITTANGTDTFDAGTINIMYE